MQNLTILAEAKSRAPLYIGIGLLVFSAILIAIGLVMRRGQSDK